MGHFKKLMMLGLFVFAMIVAPMSLTGCNDDTSVEDSAENASESMQNAAENAGDSMENAADDATN